MDSPAVARWSRIGLVVLLLAFVPAASALADDRESLGGVGLQVVPVVTGELVVLRVVEGSPAADAGLRPGDFIVRVDNQALAGTDFTEVVSRHLWGPVGSPVMLRYRRPGVTGEQSVTMRRADLDAVPEKMPGVRMLTPNE